MKRITLKCFYTFALIIFFSIFVYKNYISNFKSYTNRRTVTSRITQYCSQFSKNIITNNNENNSIRRYKDNRNKYKQRRPLSTRIGFFLIGTGKYIKFISQLINSMETYFCTNSPHIYVHYFIFTDDTKFKPFDSHFTNSNRNFTIIKQKHLNWPMSTLLRFSNILKNSEKINFFATFDFLYWLDSDMQMVDFVCEDIFGDLVATMHPHYYTSKQKYPYESYNIESRAYLEQAHRYETPYFVGAFYGGNSEEMCKLLMTCDENIQFDYNQLNGFIALVHDESHLNRYFVDNHPTVILSRAYCYSEPPEDLKYPWLQIEKPKIHAIIKTKKDKAYLRS